MPRMIDRPRALLDGSLYSFVQPAGSFSGTLHRGGLYSSRCICFLPQYFEELDRRWPDTFSGMFERFGGTWDEAQSRIIMSALLGTGPQYRPGSALLIQARIEQMVAALAASCAGDKAARCGASTRERSGLALEAQAAIERMLDEGRDVYKRQRTQWSPKVPDQCSQQRSGEVQGLRRSRHLAPHRWNAEPCEMRL